MKTMKKNYDAMKLTFDDALLILLQFYVSKKYNHEKIEHRIFSVQ